MANHVWIRETNVHEQGRWNKKSYQQNRPPMVAVIKTGSSIRRILNYNEQKVKEGVA